MICVGAVAVSQLGPGSGVPDPSPQRCAGGPRHGAGPLVQPGRSAARESDTAEGHAKGISIPAASWSICLSWERMIIQQECWCFGLCRSWTLSWLHAAGMQTVKSAEMMSFPDGFRLISTSDREMRSPCEPLLPYFSFKSLFFSPFPPPHTVLFSPLRLQGLWEREHRRPGEAHHRLLHGGGQAFHHSPRLQVPPSYFYLLTCTC